jgi:3-oxoadipate enol-lactonase
LPADFDRGCGRTVVLVPGVQGRWEWMRSALDALARGGRAISYSLRTIAGSPVAALEEFAVQLDMVLDRAGVTSAAIAGVSFGGLIAIHYAATRPRRTNALIVVSTPGPAWKPSSSQAKYISRPWLSAPVFMAAAPLRLWPEIAAAIPDRRARARFAAAQAARVLTSFPFPHAMAARARLAAELDVAADCRRVSAPALVISGAPSLDRVVAVESTREYLQLLPGAQYAMMERTGHLGLITRPELFAQIVTDFVSRC